MIDLSTETVLDELFTMNFSIGQDLRLYNVTPRLRRYLGGLEDGQSLLDVFNFHMPSDVNSFKSLRNVGSSLVLLLSKSGGHGVRGQLLPLSEAEGYRFVGMPWLAWVSENNVESALDMGDFPKFDSQMDQQFHISTQKSMVDDLQELNRGLVSAQSDWIEKNRVRSDFFAVMSHEMRTPLNGVISALSLLEDSDQGDNDKLTALAKNSADNLMTVINYALDHSKVEAGQMPLECTDFRLDELVGSATDIVVSRAQLKSIEIQTTIDANLPLHLNGDFDKLRQILINLLANSIKFTEKGSVKLKVEAVDSNFSDDSVNLCFSIEDTGCGIREQDLENIFDPFWSKRSSSAEASTGLGLNICKHLSELLGGNISVESSLGYGSCFELKVPLLLGEAPELDVVSKETGDLPKAFKGRVMLVDDNQTNLLLGKMILEKLGLMVRTASTGEESVEISEHLNFDLVLMDIAMPGISGIEAAQMINQKKDPPPIVALTAYADAELTNKYPSQGFKGYLKKPLDRNELIRELALWLEHAGENVLPVMESSNKSQFDSRTIVVLIEQIGQENFEHCKEMFLSETKERMARLFAAWVRRDLVVLAREAHAMSSSVASFGGDDFAWRLRKIETASRASHVAEVITYMKDIEAVSNLMLEDIKAYSAS